MLLFQCSEGDNERDASDSHTLSRGVKEIMKGIQVMLEKRIKGSLLLQVVILHLSWGS